VTVQHILHQIKLEEMIFQTSQERRLGDQRCGQSGGICAPNSFAASKPQNMHTLYGAHILHDVRVVLGHFNLIDLPQVRSILKTFGTNGFVRFEFP